MTNVGPGRQCDAGHDELGRICGRQHPEYHRHDGCGFGARNSRTLTLKGGTAGNITLSGAAGGSQARKTFTVTNGNNATLPAITTRSGGVSVTATTITLGGDLSTNSQTTAGAVALTGAVTLTGNRTITTDAATTGCGHHIQQHDERRFRGEQPHADADGGSGQYHAELGAVGGTAGTAERDRDRKPRSRWPRSPPRLTRPTRQAAVRP